MSRIVRDIVILFLTSQSASLAAADNPEPANQFEAALPPGVSARLGTGRFHHDAPVLSVVFSHDGKLLASAGDDFTTRVWDAGTGKELRRFWQTLMRTDRNSAGRTVHCVALARDGKQLAAGIGDGMIRLWDPVSGKELRKLPGSQGPVYCLAFSPDGKQLASGGGDSTIRLWDTKNGKTVRQMSGQDQIRALAFSPDGKSLATGEYDGFLRVWDPATGKEKRAIEAHKGSVRSLALAPDGQSLISAGTDRTIRLWDLSTAGDPLTQSLAWSVLPLPTHTLFQNLVFSCLSRETRRFTGHDDEVRCVAFAPDGSSIASAGSDRKLRFWDPATGKLQRVISGNLGKIQSLTYSPDSKWIVTGDDRNVIRFWSHATGEERPFGVGPAGPVDYAAYLSRNEILAACVDGSLKVWDSMGKSARELTPSPDSFLSIAATIDGKTIACGDGAGVITLIDTAKGSEIRHLKGHDQAVTCLIFPRDSKTLISGGKDRTVRLWDIARGLETRQWTLPDEVLGVAVTTDGRVVCTVSADESIHLWNATTGEQIRQVAETGMEVSAIAIDPEGSVLAAGSKDGNVRLWDIASGTLLRQLTEHPGGVTSLVFSTDGKVLAVGSWLNVRLWELASGRECCRYDQQPGFVLSLAFAPDGKNLALADGAGQVLIADLAGQSTAKEQGALKERDLPGLWEDLASDNAVPAYRAGWRLALHPELSIPFLASKVRPVPALSLADRQHIAEWVKQLDHDDFEIRERAANQLAKAGEGAEHELRKALVNTASPELRRRIAELRQHARQLGAGHERLRSTRAVAVLEQMGTPPANAVLKTLAGGAEDAALTKDAREALERLKRR